MSDDDDQRISSQKNVEISKTIEVRISNENALIKREIELETIKENSRELMEKVIDKVPWFLPDHGWEHVKRVVEHTKNSTRLFNEISIYEKLIGHKLNDEDMNKLLIAAYLHDIGRGFDKEKLHTLSGAEYIQSHEDLVPSRYRKNVAKICELHSKSDTRKTYGTSNLSILMKKGLISSEIAFLASILRISDGLDASAKRAQANTKGESFKTVIKKIKQIKQKYERDRSLGHWYGHLGISECWLYKSNNKLMLEFELNESLFKEHGGRIAYKILDVLKEFNSTLLQARFDVIFRSKNIEYLKKWYERHGDIISDELEGISLYFGQTRGGD